MYKNMHTATVITAESMMSLFISFHPKLVFLLLHIFLIIAINIIGFYCKKTEQKSALFEKIFYYFLSLFLISTLLILPLIVLGSSSTNSTILGYL